jgi:antitoxin StbD
LVYFKDNNAEQNVVGVDAVQTRADELEDLRSELLALARIASLDLSTTLSLEEMEARTNYYPVDRNSA